MNIYDFKDKAWNEADEIFAPQVLPFAPAAELEQLHSVFADSNDRKDAFRHAYVSGRFSLEHGMTVAYFLGLGLELKAIGHGTFGNTPEQFYMDMNSNFVGCVVAATSGNRN